MANLTAFSKALSASNSSMETDVLLDAVKASIAAKNVSKLVNNGTVAIALTKYVEKNPPGLENYTLFTIDDSPRWTQHSPRSSKSRKRS